MPLSVGCDLVDVDEVADALSRFGDRYLERVFTRAERDACRDGADARRLAAVFAAKEATLKALEIEDHAVEWRSIDVATRRDGAASVSLTGAAASVARARGIVEIHVSTTTTRTYASAVAIARRSRERQSDAEG